jgi:hypothetical protein
MILKTQEQLIESGYVLNEQVLHDTKDEHKRWHTNRTLSKNGRTITSDLFKFLGSEVTVQLFQGNCFVLEQFCAPWPYDTIHSVTINQDHRSTDAGRTLEVFELNAEFADLESSKNCLLRFETGEYS